MLESGFKFRTNVPFKKKYLDYEFQAHEWLSGVVFASGKLIHKWNYDVGHVDLKHSLTLSNLFLVKISYFIKCGFNGKPCTFK